MFLQRSLFFYLFVFIIITIIYAVINSQEDSVSWLDKVAPQEKVLYDLELSVPLSDEDINMTKAMIFYKTRQTYCESLANDKEQLLCYKRTMPWWSKIYRQKEQQIKH